MAQLNWNSRVDILVCDNAACDCYRQPGLTMRKGEAAPASKAKLPGWLVTTGGRKPKFIPPEEFTDGEEANPAFEDLRRMREKLSAKKEDSEVP